MTTVAVMGSTGSVGTQTFDVIRADREAFDVVAIGAGTSAQALIEQAKEFEPKLVVTADAATADVVRADVPDSVTVAHGPEALADASRSAEAVVNGVVGFAGLPVTLAALESGRRLALANKESLISAGPVVQRARATPGAELLPVDSEHCALHQCLRSNEALGDSGRPTRVSRLVVTASGGPFRGYSSEQLAAVSVEQALQHPTWSMGPKITVDSSTLMNKGLEVIEAHELYGTPYDDIDVVVHPQSVVHSMVEYTDGSTMAQLSMPDMRLCIGYALAYPDRITTAYGKIDWTELSRLDFEPPDRQNFGCLDLAYQAGRLGETAPAWLNAANEVVVQAFLDGDVAWTDIAAILTEILDQYDETPAESADVIYDVDARARKAATQRIKATQ